MFLKNSETFDVSHRTFFKIYTGGAKALKGFAFPLSIKSSFLSENKNRKNRAKIT